MGFGDRLRQYVHERFPQYVYLPLVGAVAWAAVALFATFRGGPAPSQDEVLIAMMSGYAAFFHLQAVDDIRDLAAKGPLRRDLPVGGGGLTVQGLVLVCMSYVAVQVLVVSWVSLLLLLPLAFVWMWTVLRAAGYFIGPWLRLQPLPALAAKASAVPIVVLWLTAFDWLPAGTAPRLEITWLVVLAFFTGIVLEIGRTRPTAGTLSAPALRYAEAWGPGNAGLAWLMAMILMAISATVIAMAIGNALPMLVLGIVLVALSVVVANRFRSQPNASSARVVWFSSWIGVTITFAVLAASAARIL